MSVEQSNAVHEKFGTPASWRHEIDGLIFPFNPEWKTVAVNLSGGADSAMCANLLATIISDNSYDTRVHIISHSRVWRNRPWQAHVQISVYEKLKEMFPEVIGNRIENFIPPQLEESSSGKTLVDGKSGDRVIVSEFNHYAAWRYKLDTSYNAVTANPTESDFFHEKMPHDRQYDIETLETNVMLRGDTILPFKFIAKDWIVKQYYERNLLDLFNLTRSCEGDITTNPELFTDDYTSYVHGVSHLPSCNSCFWCAERSWAIDKVKNETP